MDNKQQKPKQKPFEGCLSFIGLCAVLSILLVLGSEMCGSKEVAKNPKAIFANTEDFRTRFNAFSKEHNTGLSIQGLEVKKGDKKDVFVYFITPTLSINGEVDKETQTVEGITIIGVGNGSFSSAADIIIAAVTLIACADPSLNTEGRRAVLNGLHVFDKDNDLSEMNEKVNRNGIHYYAISSQQIGFWFGVNKNLYNE